jgi:subtilisin family serine protease
MTIVSPGTARSAITVGAYAVDRRVGGVPQLDVMDVSGRGPTLDGRTKPDLVAYGGAVAGPAPVVPSRYAFKSGTSAAAPQAAGAAALAFQSRGETLHAADVAWLLRSLADGRRDGPDNGWGWGKLRLAGIQGEPHAGPRLLVRKHARDSGATPYAGPAPWTAPDIRVVPVGPGNSDGCGSHPARLVAARF